MEPYAWNLPIGILGGIVGALIGRIRENDKETVQVSALYGTLFGILVGGILAVMEIRLGALRLVTSNKCSGFTRQVVKRGLSGNGFMLS